MGPADDSVVTIFGSGDGAPGEAAYEQARAVGGALARLGYAVANGGYGGTMAGSAQGAVEAGGTTLGVTCAIWRSQPNPYIRRVVPTADLPERVGRLVELGRGGYVALPGGTGTLAELAWVWEEMSKGRLARRPIVCFGEFWSPLVAMMASVRSRSAEFVAVVRSVEQLGEHFPPRGRA